MTAIPFTKMHGIGNDYVYVDGFETFIRDPAKLARVISDRHYGVGSDGLILILPPERGVEADVRMRMFNADGSESAMCGNGVRCVCKYAHDHGRSRRSPMRVQTGAGVLTLEYGLGAGGTVESVCVDMGAPILEIQQIPAIESRLPSVLELLRSFDLGGALIDEISDPSDLTAIGLVSMGNPHLVLLVQDVSRIPLETIGPALEHHPAFPQRINVHVASAHSPLEISMRTWERGAGITLACGTGSAAVCVTAARRGLTNREVLVHLPGGDLQLEWDARDDHVRMTGPATEVYRGLWIAGEDGA